MSQSTPNSRNTSVQSTKHSFNASTGEMVVQPESQPFLRGPIPLSWLNRAAKLPGKTLNVALAIWWLYGMIGRKPLKLSKKALGIFQVSADAATDALNRMDQHGLIKLQKKSGQRPLIEVILEQ